MLIPEKILYPLFQKIAARPALAELVFFFDPWGNPLGETFARDPSDAVAAMHREGPVTYRALYRHWIVTGYEEALEIFSRDDLLVGDPIGVLLGVKPYKELSALAKWTFQNLILVSDPPSHTRLRRAVQREFTPSRTERLEARIKEVAEDRLAHLAQNPNADLVRDYATPLANAAVASLIGIPKEDWGWSQEMTNVIVQLLDPLLRFDPEIVSGAIDELFAYFETLCDRRKQHPQQDLLSAMLQVEDQKLNRKEIITMAIMMLGAGSQTTGGLLANSVFALSRFPDQQELLRKQSGLWPNAIEEFCRFDTSVKFAPRTTVSDLKIGGKTIPSGSNLMIQIVAANRDPRRYADPDRLQLDRKDPQPLTFGYGMHFCLGAALTRLVLRVGLTALLERFSAFEIDQKSTTWRKSLLLRGANLMPFKGVQAR
ncbi:cytochrome P450 [Roseibium sp. MMSF_3544]|uniref:cytochrome P450 n=1 Tax=unclassified Roseibium TaxID=2629323 RepID=UPI00273F9BF2|nr:cytochrome P450 [Roseibium sp. MMSF_3544]